MSWASGEVVGILTFLLPGFVAAAIFYSLTSHPKPGAFERVVQALIFTMVVRAIIMAQLVNRMRYLVTAAARQARSLAPGARPTRWNQLR